MASPFAIFNASFNTADFPGNASCVLEKYLIFGLVLHILSKTSAVLSVLLSSITIISYLGYSILEIFSIVFSITHPSL